MRGGSRAAIAVGLACGAVSCARSGHGPAPALAPIDDGLTSAQQPTSVAPSASPLQVVPEYLRAACGHPGAQVTLATVPITIPRAQCDLTGVVVLYGQIGVTVPSEGGVNGVADGISSASELTASVDPITGDVTFN